MAVNWKKQSVEELSKQKSRAQLQKELEELTAKNAALEKKNTALEGQVDDAMIALCEVYEMLVGDVE